MNTHTKTGKLRARHADALNLIHNSNIVDNTGIQLNFRKLNLMVLFGHIRLNDYFSIYVLDYEITLAAKYNCELLIRLLQKGYIQKPCASQIIWLKRGNVSIGLIQ